MGKWAARLAEKTPAPLPPRTDKTDIRGLPSVLAVTPTGRERELHAATEPHRRAYRLSAAEADRCHVEPWDDATIARFVARVGLLMRRGFDATDADDLAERLHLRDVQGDDRVLCAECQHYRRGQCSNHHAAGLHGAEMSRDLAVTPQRCPGFGKVE